MTIDYLYKPVNEDLTMKMNRRRSIVWLLALVAATVTLASDAFSASRPFALQRVRTRQPLLAATKDGSIDDDSASTEVVPKAPTLNGKMILPYKVMVSGLKGSNMAAVYAVLSSHYKRGSGDGWEHVQYVGVSRDLEQTLQMLWNEYGDDSVAHVRALSFSYPQQAAMEHVASEWRTSVEGAGGSLQPWTPGPLLDDEDVDEDDEDEDWLMETAPPPPSEPADKVISPFSEGQAEVLPGSGGGSLEFTRENVDKVLDEVRPYLISDGGNVAVDSVDVDTQTVYLVLEGACGSCPSSTVTMQMGIERVLKENFPNLAEVVQVDDPSQPPEPTELTWEAVRAEVDRIKPAIIAMGGVVEIKNVDPIGEVTLEFRGGNKLKQGLELAVLDVPYCNHVKFVM